MTTSALRIERDGAVARVWLDRPEIRNALNAALIGELATTFAALAADDGGRQARVSILPARARACVPSASA